MGYLGQDTGSGTLWKGPERLGSGIAWIWGWLNESPDGGRASDTLETGWVPGGEGTLNPVPGDVGKGEVSFGPHCLGFLIDGNRSQLLRWYRISEGTGAGLGSVILPP